MTTKATTTNPKDLFGSKKVSLTKLPAIAEAHGAMAMMDGAEKYGPYNWREKDVIASIYVDAAKRHLNLWFEGQQSDPISLVHHLGHAIACCSILLDAEAFGCLIDDRPPADVEMYEDAMAEMMTAIEARRARTSAAKAAAEAATETPDGGPTIVVDQSDRWALWDQFTSEMYLSGPTTEPGRRIDVKYRDGKIDLNVQATNYRWSHTGSEVDIVGWRHHE